MANNNSDWYIDNSPKQNIDNSTNYGIGIGLEPKIDPITNWGKGIFYYGLDGNKYPTSDMAAQADKEFWRRMMIKDKHAERDANSFSFGITSKDYNPHELLAHLINAIDFNSQCTDIEFLKAQRAEIDKYVKAVYGTSLDELIAQFDYTKHDSGMGTGRK